ncbi:MAG: hypothetical protein MUC28_02910, partial [Planctomycetes bacterium]|nr:hypothetical protein [Planctomycetota bacterium]
MKIKIYLIALLSIIFASPIPAVCQTIFEWDFESGGNSWLVEGAIRESGEQATLPDQCLSGNNCAGFIINAGGCDSDEIRLVSPEIKLPEARIKSELHLAFRHALRLSSISDYGAKAWIQISVDNGEWQTIFGPFVGNKPGWADVDID